MGSSVVPMVTGFSVTAEISWPTLASFELKDFLRAALTGTCPAKAPDGACWAWHAGQKERAQAHIRTMGRVDAVSLTFMGTTP